MKASDFIYAPALKEEFRCGVTLKDTRQVYLIDGRVQGASAPMSFRLKEGESLDGTLQIIAVRKPDRMEELEFSQNFDFAAGSRGRIVQCAHTSASGRTATREHITISIGAGASVEYTVMQHEDNGSLHETSYNISLAEGASLNMVFITLHGGVTGNRIKVSLDGRHADCSLSGLSLTDGDQTSDYAIELIHNQPECTSHQLFKGILDNHGKSHFDGLIRVVPGAQKTEAYQADHNLLLSDTARAYSKPQLEIYADDVKCSHGATVGRLSEEELFYMRTRGISLKEARLLQQMAFAGEVLQKISSPELRERMISMVERRLRG